MTAKPLTAQEIRERAFSAHYAANGGNATDAAIKAGYAAGGAARVQGYRMLQRKSVQDEIARLQQGTAAHVGRLLTHANRTSERLTKKAAKVLTEAVEANLTPDEVSVAVAPHDPGMAIALTRAYAQFGLTQALGMALGQVPRVSQRIVKGNTVTSRLLKSEPGPAAYCATLLNKEIDRIEGVPPAPVTIEGELAEETPGAKVARVWREKMGLAPMPDDYDPSKEPGYR